MSIATQQALPLDKTAFGMIDSLDQLFDGFEYFEHVITKGSGSYIKRPSGWYFLSAEQPGIPVQTFGGKRRQWLLCAKPSASILAACLSRWEPDSFRLIPWHRQGVALVMASNSRYINEIWLGFIPLSAIQPIEYKEESK